MPVSVVDAALLPSRRNTLPSLLAAARILRPFQVKVTGSKLPSFDGEKLAFGRGLNTSIDQKPFEAPPHPPEVVVKIDLPTRLRLEALAFV